MDAVSQAIIQVLRLVHELHTRGYQLLRIAPGMAPSGCYWRCSVSPQANMLKIHGAMLYDSNHLTAFYTSGQENEYFGWQDAKQDNVQQLAQKFIDRFPEIIDASHGDDDNYASWYVIMLGLAEDGFFPYAYSDWGPEEDEKHLLPLLGAKRKLLLPPPGDAE